jgi:16S rRNA (uracil1498-N3)-methyltransferase
VPRISEVVGAAAVFAAGGAGVKLILVEPRACDEAMASVDHLREAARGGALLAVGPEGGWSSDELRQASAGDFVTWTLGGTTLRADAVPVAALAVLRYAWGLSNVSANQSSSSSRQAT